jgi:hypothetical protein
MPTYTVYFLDDQRSIVSFDFVAAEADSEAWARVPHMLKFRTESRNVEIYEGARRVPESAAHAAASPGLAPESLASCPK